jgi:hypothetical protein
MSEIGERLARVETRIDSMESKLCDMGTHIKEIHETVVCNSTNMSWVKKMLIIVITCIIGGGTVFGYKTFTGNISPARAIDGTNP